MRTVLRCFLACCFLPLHAAAQTWTAAPDTLPEWVHKISFVSADTGYVISGATQLFYTTNRGADWTERNLPAVSGPALSLQALHFLTPQLGFVSARNNISHLFKTTDGGATWTDIIPDSANLGNGTSTVHFVNDQQGFFATGSELSRTTDGGMTWTDTTLNAYIQDIEFADPLHGFAGFWDGTFAYAGGVFATADGGLTWNRTDFPQLYSEVKNLSTPEAGVCYALATMYTVTGSDIVVFRTFDGGMSWDTVTAAAHPAFVDGTDIVFQDRYHGWISSNANGIFMSLDSGMTWAQDGAPLGTFFTSMAYAGGIVFSGTDGQTQDELWYRSGVNMRSDPMQGSFHVYPVPAAAGTQLRAEAAGAHALCLISLQGQVLMEQLFAPYATTHEFTLPDDLPAGVYLLRAVSAAGMQTARIVVY